MKVVGILFFVSACFASSNEHCEDKLSRELAKCRRKVIQPNHATHVRIEKSVHFAIENCTTELIPQMTAQDYLLKTMDDPDFKKQMYSCFSSRQLEKLHEYGIGDEYANLRYKKCVRDVIEHEKHFGHKKE